MPIFLFPLLFCSSLTAELSPYALFKKRHPAHPATRLSLENCSSLEAHALVTRQDFQARLTTPQKNALIPYRDTLGAHLRAARHPRFPAAAGYQATSVIGWTVFVDEGLWENHEQKTKRALRLLEFQLQDIIERLPTPAVTYLKKVPLYFSLPANGHGGACHHPSSIWLKNNGHPVEKVKAVEFSNILNFDAETRRMPNVTLHELAHAYHNHLLGDDHPTILKVYRAAKESGKFTHLPVRTGNPKKPLVTSRGLTYGMTNQMEYFAETTEAYFAENDITPYDRASLKEWDPAVIPVLEKVWGVSRSAHPLLAADRILFLGDSITAANHYIVDLQASLHLKGHFPEVIACGLGSEGVTGLSEPKHPFPRPNVHERLARALEKSRPDLVIACYGMNDGIYHPFSDDRFQKYQDGLQRLIKTVKKSGAKIILCTPPPFDRAAHKDAQPAGAKEFYWGKAYQHYDREVIAPYARWVMAQQNEVTKVIDIHSPFSRYYQEQRKTHPNFRLSSDGVHLDREGHRLFAKIVYRELFGKELPLLPPNLVDFYAKRQSFLAPAWLSHIGHKRPKVKPGLQLEVAQALAAAVLRD